MRLASIVSSNYGESASLASYPGGVQSANEIYQRLVLEDTGFTVEWTAGQRDLPETLESWLQSQSSPVEGLLFHFSGYLAWRERLGLGLALDGERGRAWPLAQLCGLLDRFCEEYCILLDAVLVSARYPRAHVRESFERELASHVRATGVLAVQPADTTLEVSAFARLAVWGLDSLGGAGTVTAEQWYQLLEPELVKLESSHTFSFAGRGAFELLPSREPAWSMPAPAPAPVAVTVAEELEQLDARAAQLEARGEWAELAQTLEDILDRSGGTAAHEVALELASVSWARLHDPARAVETLSRVVAVDGGSASVRLALSDLYAAEGQLGVAIEQCVAGVALDPFKAPGYRRAFERFREANLPDRAYNAASALAALGAGDSVHREVADAQRPLGLQAARATLQESHWQDLSIRGQRHRTLERIVSLVAEPAIEHRLRLLKKQKRLPVLEPSARHDPLTSTTTIGRSLAWTARLNNVECPELYVYESDEPKMGPVPSVARACLVSKAFARGFSLPELTFLWGRALTYFRPEHYPLVFFDSVDDMVRLLLAAARASDPHSSRDRAVEPDVLRLATHLSKSLGTEAREEIRSVTERLTSAKACGRVERWVASIDEAANRAGLIACGDVRVATDMMARFPTRGPDSVHDHTGDVLKYSVGAEYATIRAHLGVAVG